MSRLGRLDLGAIDGIGLALFVLMLVVYATTLAPSAQFEDDGELAAAAYTLGIPHPTGYPLFSWLTALVARIPWGDSVFLRLNALMAILCAIATWMFYRAFLLFLSDTTVTGWRRAPAAVTSRAQASQAPTADGSDRIAAATAAAALGFGFQFWTNALSLEVYALHLVFLGALLWTYLKALSALTLDAGSGRARRLWQAFAFLLGLSFTNHLMTVLLAPAFLYFYFAAFGFKRPAWARIVRAIPVFALGLAPYLYLPLRAAAKPLINWGDPSNWPAFIAHVSGRQYRYAMYSSAEIPVDKLSAFLAGLPRELGYLPLLAALFGAIALWRRSRRMLTFALLLVAACLFYAVNYAFDDPNFYLNAYVALALVAAYGLRSLLDAKSLRGFRLLLGAAIVVSPLLVHYSVVDKTGNYAQEDYARNVLSALEPNAVLITDADSWVAMISYLQWVESLRTDVVMIDRNLAISPWYWTQLAAQHPGLSAKDYDPSDLRGADPVGAWVRREIRNRPVYASSLKNATYAQGLHALSAGPAFRLYPAPPESLPPEHKYRYRPLPPRAKNAEEFRSFYVSGYVNQGFDRMNRGDTAAAVRLFREALAVDPGHPRLLQLLRQFDGWR